MRQTRPCRRAPGYGKLPSQAGFTLLQTVISLTILMVMLALAGQAMTLQSNVMGQATDDHNVFLPALRCLERIRDELKSTSQDGPGYSLSATSVSYRPVKNAYTTNGVKAYTTGNNVEYQPFLKTITYDATAGTVVLTATGTLPAGMPASEVLARDVTTFYFFDGLSSSLSAAASPPTTDTWVVGVEIEIGRASAQPAAKGSVVASTVGDRTNGKLRMKIRVEPESLVNSKSLPVVGP